MQRLDGESATREGHARHGVAQARAKVLGQHVAIHRGGHEAEVERAVSQQQPPQRQKQEVILHRPFVHFVDDDVSRRGEGRVLQRREAGYTGFGGSA
eukprot:7380362-Prymnesium_polylepis.1